MFDHAPTSDHYSDAALHLVEATGVASLPNSKSLAQLTLGETATVTDVTDPTLKLAACRLGIHTGCQLTLQAVIPAGPFVVTLGATELALGRELCQHIQVAVTEFFPEDGTCNGQLAPSF